MAYLVQAKVIGVSFLVLQGLSQEMKYFAVVPGAIFIIALTFRAGRFGENRVEWLRCKTPMGRVQMTWPAVKTRSSM